MKKVAVAVLAGFVIGLLAFYLGQRAFAPKAVYMTPACEARVKLSVVGNGIDVQPPNVCLFVDHRLKWDVVSAEGDKVEIDFKVGEGPFVYVNSATNTKPGHYEIQRPGEIDSNVAKTGTEGPWRYTIKWTVGADGTVITLDPVVCIRKG
jgi:hypothetical protein